MNNLKQYFYKKEYLYMYLSSFTYSFANALKETFGAVMLYKSGMELWLIFIIYGFRFLITGIFSPLFLVLSSKFGISKCILVSNIFSIICAYLLLNGVDNSNMIFFIIAVGFEGISNPATDALSSKYVDTNNRGKFNSVINISKILGQVLATVLLTIGIITNNNNIIFLLIIISYLLQFIFTLKIDYKTIYKCSPFIDSFKYLLKSKGKYKTIYALRTNHIIERLFIPLYLYIILKDIKMFSMVMIISLVFQFITVILTGKYTDKNIRKSNDLVTIIKTFLTSIFIFGKGKFLISFNKTISDNFEKVYETSIQTSIQNIIKNSSDNNELLAVIGQMSLCFTEVLVFALLSLLSIFIHNNIFVIIFIFSILSTILIDIYIKKVNNLI